MEYLMFSLSGNGFKERLAMSLALMESPNVYRRFWKMATRFSLALMLLITTQVVSAVTPQKSPHEVVQLTTNQLMTTVKEHRSSFDTEPDLLYMAVESVLEPVVDFQRISRIVMDRHYKVATKDQLKRFASVFKRNLVATYAKGLVNYSSLDVVTLVPKSLSEGKKKIGVRQEINTDEGIVSISYTMMRNRNGEWKVLNVILNGVNLGQIFRNQFLQALRKSEGDIDQVIDTWTGQV